MQSKSPHNPNDPLITVVAILGGVAILLMVLWYQCHSYLSWIAIQSAWISIPVLENSQAWATSIGVPKLITTTLIPNEILQDIPSLKYWLPRTDPELVKFDEFINLFEVFGYTFRLFSPILAIICIIYVWKRSKAARLSRTLNIFSLAQHTMIQFPQIRPAIIENLLKVNPDSGYYRREDSPIRFAIKNGLIKAHKVNFKEELLPEIFTPTFDKKLGKQGGYEFIKDNLTKNICKLHNRCILDIEKTETIFVQQLGEPWTGSQNLPPFIKGLYAALITFASADKDTSFELLDQFNRSWQPPKNKRNVAKIDTTGVEKLIKKYEPTEHIQSLINSHAFVTTVMSRLLEAAREKGRIATPLFLWLKAIDRTLWYALNQEGGQCGWSEAAGPRAHKIAEQKVKGPVYKPYVATAVSEFKDYLSDREGWIPLDEHLPNALGEK